MLALYSLAAQAQTFMAGDPLNVYVDVEPDTVLNYSPCPPDGGGLPLVTESYFLDMDGDSQNDFELKAFCDFITIPGTQYVAVRPLNPGSFARWVWSDSIYVAQYEDWVKRRMAEMLSNGEIINSSGAPWVNETVHLTYYTNDPYYTLTANNWVTGSDHFIALRHGSGNTFRYGWVRATCSSPSVCTVRDYAFSQEIVEDDTGLGNLQASVVAIRHDPSSSTVTIEMDPAGEMELMVSVHDLVGREVGLMTRYAVATGLSRRILDISSLGAGQYVISCADRDHLLGTLRITKL